MVLSLNLAALLVSGSPHAKWLRSSVLVLSGKVAALLSLGSLHLTGCAPINWFFSKKVAALVDWFSYPLWLFLY
jgi:hypothetical protein